MFATASRMSLDRLEWLAFGRSVLKGMAAPCSLYSACEMLELPPVAVVVPFTMSAAEALEADGQRVQGDIIKALQMFDDSPP